MYLETEDCLKLRQKSDDMPVYKFLKNPNSLVFRKRDYTIQLHHQDDYQYLLNDADKDKMEWLKLFQKFDLYSKDKETMPDIDQLKEYYQKLIDKYIPGKIKF